MKANHLPKRNTSMPDVPENRKKCLLTPPEEDKTLSQAPGSSEQQAGPWAVFLASHGRLREAACCDVVHSAGGMGREVPGTTRVPDDLTVSRGGGYSEWGWRGHLQIPQVMLSKDGVSRPGAGRQ